MKFKNTAVIFSLVLIFSIFNMGFVPAPSHPVEICSDGKVYDFVSGNGECKNNEEIWENVEPPTFFGGFSTKLKFAFSSPETKLKLSAVLTAQQIAQLEEALAEGDYKKAEAVSEDIRQTFEKSGRWLEEFNGEGINYNEFYKGDDEFNDFLYTKRMYVQDIEKLNEIQGTILEKIDAGETTHVAVENIFKNFGEEGRVVSKFDEKQEEFIYKVADEGGVTGLEIKYAINNEDKNIGITEYYKNYDAQDYAVTMAKLDSLRTEIADSDKPYSREVENLFDEARLRAQLSQSEIQNGHYSDGYNEFYKSQYIMYNLENYAEEGERALNQIDENVVVGPVELNKEIEEENKQFVEEYAQAKEIIAEEYPEELKNLDASYIVAQDVVALSEKINEVAEEELTKLEEAGKTEEEAKEIIEEKKAEEYYYNYGGKYSPPEYVRVFSDEETKEINYDYGGGFVKRFDYSDASHDTNYRFGDNGYSWTTWTGEKYSTPHPADYEPERVRRGDEVFKSEVETDDGNYNYEYYATGYKTIAPDGTETENLYSDVADKMQFTGGALVDYDPTGYVVTYKGEAQVWQGNPAFDNYINLADGKVFVPEVSPQEDATYDAEKKVYEYDYGGVKWEFDPATKVLTNEVTKQPIPTVAPDAPIGHEEEKELKTEDGTIWTYEENAEKFAWHWKGADGIEGDYIPSPNNYYSYDDETDSYYDTRGNSYVGTIDYRGEKWTMQGGAWVSEGKTTYDPKTGKTYIQVGDAIEEVGADYKNYGRIYDSSGKEIRSYNYDRGEYAWDPRTNSYAFYDPVGIVNYDPANPPKHELKDAEGKVITTWIQDRNGRWRVEGSKGDTGYFGYEKYSNLAEIGTTVVGDDGKKYYVDSKLGWATADENGNSYAVAPPMVGGKQQPSSAMRTGMPGGNYATGGYPGYYGGYYDATTGNYVGATGCSGGCYGDYGYGASYYSGSYSNNLGHIQNSDGTWRPATSQAEADAARATGTYSAPGTPAIGIYGATSGSYMAGPNAWTASGTYPGAYTGGSYPGGYDATTGASGYYQNGAWVSTPSTSYGGSYASYYGSYAGGGAEVGRTTTYNGQVYTVDAVKGWTDASGNAVAPPPGQPSSATGGYYPGGSSYSSGGYYDSSGSWVSSGGTSYSTSGTPYSSYPGGYYGSYDPAGSNYAGSYSTSGPNAWTASGTSSGAYTGGWNYDSATGTYTPSGGYTVGAGTYDSATGTYSYGSNTYSGGTYDSSTGSYTVSGSGSYSGSSYSGGSTGTYSGSGSYSGSSYSGGSTGTYSGSGSYSGGDTSTSSSTSTSTSSGGDSGGTTSSGGDSGGSSGGESAPTGGVISEPESNLKDGWFRSFWKSLFR